MPEQENNREQMGEVVDFKVPEKKVESGRGYKMKIEYGNEQTGTHTYLKNGARIEINPLVMPELIDSKSSELKEAEEAVAEGIDISDDEGVQDIKEQITESELEGVYIKYITAIFREYGDQVGMASKESGGVGMDENKLGNIVDFDEEGAMVLVISEKGKGKMKQLISDPPTNLIDTGIEFRQPYYDYLRDNSGNEIGFTVKITCGNENQPSGSTLEKKLYFLFAQDENSEITEKEQSDAEEEELPLAA